MSHKTTVPSPADSQLSGAAFPRSLKRVSLQLATASVALLFGSTVFGAAAPAPLNTLHSTPEQRVGSPIGGLGTGFLELWPDGSFHDWSIFNRGMWAYQHDFFKVNPTDREVLADMD